MKPRPGALLLNAVLIAGAFLTVAPLLWMLSASLMPTGQANTSPPPLLPSRVTFEHYVELFTHLNLARSFANSLLVSVVGTLATLAVSVFMSSWNDFLWPLVILSDDRRYTLPVALASLVGEHVQDTELMMAGAVVTVLPVLALFVVLQRWYIRGVMAGSVKG